jgi:transposase InsO family protein
VHSLKFRQGPHRVRVHQGRPEPVQRPGDVPRTRRGTGGVLRLAQATTLQPDARLLRLIRTSFIASQGINAARRVFLDLREAAETCSKHRVARLVRERALRALHGYRMRRWSVGKPSALIPNLLQRQFTVTRPNKTWGTDITHIRTWQGWLYLAVVKDLFSRRIVGWATGPTTRASSSSMPC